MLRTNGVQKLNGGGVTWKEARLQCEGRGKFLAMVFTNEAADIIANAMLKSRPCNEASFVIYTLVGLEHRICLMTGKKQVGVSKRSFSQ